MPRKDRFNVLQNIYNGLNHGGVYLYRKTVCEDSRLQENDNFLIFMIIKENILRYQIF